MPVIPWRSYQAPKAGETYVVMASHLPLKQHRMVPVMLKLARAIQGQLHEAEGLVGYALDAQIKTKTFLTVSAWKSRDALETFSSTAPHLDVMRKLGPHLEPTTFATWEVDGDEIDLSWHYVRRKLAEAQPKA